MASVLCLTIVVVAIIASIQGSSPGFSQLFKGIEEEENEYDHILKITVINLRPKAYSNIFLLWPNGIVPYEISKEFNSSDIDVIFEAINEFHNQTCVRFRPRKGEASHIYFEPGEGGCWAIHGKLPEKITNVSLAPGCMKKGVVMHELMHTLGFIHEQKRPDRDEYVRIDFDNIIDKQKDQFEKYEEDEVHTFNVSYDYGSLMHYDRYAFAKNEDIPTIIPLRKDAEDMGQEEGFSEKDLFKINVVYNCTITNTEQEINETMDESFY